MILSHTVLPESVRKRVTGSLKERSKDRDTRELSYLRYATIG